MQSPKPPLLVVIMDGIGERPAGPGNAVTQAVTPHLDELRKDGLFTTLQAHGVAVGLPTDHDIGNSEVGHNAIGAGRVFSQGATLVNEALASGSLFSGSCWQDLVGHLSETNGRLHLIGLLSDGNVHAHERHLHRLIERGQEITRQVVVHPLLDGRDVGEKTAEVFVDRLAAVVERFPDKVLVGSGGGRMLVTMDRYEADWQIVERGWHAHVLGEAPHRFSSLEEAVSFFRSNQPELSDQNIPPFVIVDHDKKSVGTIEDGDAVVFFNFRGDRAIEISRAFTEEDWPYFDRKRNPRVFFAGMMQYDGDLHIPPRFLVEPPVIDKTLSQVLLKHGIQQFACSETQKFGHVTFFWNGNRSGYLDPEKEQYVEIPSDTGITFDKAPEMKANEITEATISALEGGRFRFARINYANGDMVGHTGNLPAAIHAVETVDRQIGKLRQFADRTGCELIITADHGNADEMLDADGRPKTSHTLAPVPLYIYTPSARGLGFSEIQDPGLGHLANTVLAMLGLSTEGDFLPSLVEVAHD